MCEISRATAPPFVTVICCAELVVPSGCAANVREEAESVAAARPPAPVSCKVRGLPTELSVMVGVPVRVPAAVGVNVTFIAQVPPAAAKWRSHS
jgi:hypothetical protein